MLCRAVKISQNMQKRVAFQVKTLATNKNRERVHPAVFYNLTSSPTHTLTQIRKHTHTYTTTTISTPLNCYYNKFTINNGDSEIDSLNRTFWPPQKKICIEAPEGALKNVTSFK